MDQTTDVLQQLVAIDSINPDLVPGGAGEGEIARFVAHWLEQAGLEVQVDEPVAGRPNVIGIARGSGSGRSLLLNAHMDTVGVTGMQRPHEPVIEGTRLYGRGAYDMKAGLAAIMAAAAEARKLSLRGDVIVTAVADEEYASIGTQSIVKHCLSDHQGEGGTESIGDAGSRGWHVDAAIVTEPTALQLCVAHKGFMWFEIQTRGTAAHGSRPDLGRDAIIKMGHVLLGLERLNQDLRARPAHRLLGHASLHASLIQGGQELSSYPEQCILQVERRTLPGETPEQVEAELQHLLDQLSNTDPAFEASLKTTLVRSSLETPEDAEIVKHVQRQATRLSSTVPEIVGHPAWMDAALLSAAGVPTVVFGPGGEGAHAVVEWADLEQLTQCRQVLLSVIQEFCA